jgi:hypothetical protein
MTPYELRSRFMAIHRDVYVPRGTEITAVVRARAAWLRSRRRGIVAGRSASALHGANWIDNRAPAEILYENRHAPAAIRAWSDRVLDDEVTVANGPRVTTPARTAFDLACRYPVDEAVTMIDALARATRLKVADVELLAQRYKGRRGIRNACLALDLVDSVPSHLARPGCVYCSYERVSRDQRPRYRFTTLRPARRDSRYGMAGHQGRRRLRG